MMLSVRRPGVRKTIPSMHTGLMISYEQTRTTFNESLEMVHGQEWGKKLFDEGTITEHGGTEKLTIMKKIGVPEQQLF